VTQLLELVVQVAHGKVILSILGFHIDAAWCNPVR